MEKRRSKELQYLIHPYRPARLIDEGRFLGKQRDPSGLALAEAKLKDLGFKKEIDRKVVSFTREYPRAVVYADHRNDGGLHFVIAPKPLDLNAQQWEVWNRPVKTYRLPDRWKNDLAKKLDEAVDAAVPPAPPVLTAQILKFPGAAQDDGLETGV